MSNTKDDQAKSKDYEVYKLGDRLISGRQLKIGHRVFVENADISTLTFNTVEELQRMKKESIDKEQEAYEAVINAAAQWDRLAADTQKIQQSIEYLETPKVQHSSNQWKTNGKWESISNQVYEMRCGILEDVKYEPKMKQMIPVAWRVTWNVCINSPVKKYPKKIAGECNQCYRDKDAAVKYLEEKKKAYAHLFTQISPAIPKGYEKFFMVHGTLLPGYIVEVR